MKFIKKNLPTLFSLLLSLMTSNSLIFAQERIRIQEDNLDESDDAMSTTPSSIDENPGFFFAFCKWPDCKEEFTAKPLYKKHCQEHFYKAYKAVHKNSRFRCPLKINGDQKRCREILSKDTFSTHCKKKHDFHYFLFICTCKFQTTSDDFFKEHNKDHERCAKNVRMFR